MSVTLTGAVALVSALSPELKTAVVSAVETHLADVTAQVNKVKAAVQADLPSVTSTTHNVEALVAAEFAKLKADFSFVPTWLRVAGAVVGAVALVGGGVAVDHLVKFF